MNPELGEHMIYVHVPCLHMFMCVSILFTCLPPFVCSVVVRGACQPAVSSLSGVTLPSVPWLPWFQWYSSSEGEKERVREGGRGGGERYQEIMQSFSQRMS